MSFHVGKNTKVSSMLSGDTAFSKVTTQLV